MRAIPAGSANSVQHTTGSAIAQLRSTMGIPTSSSLNPAQRPHIVMFLMSGEVNIDAKWHFRQHRKRGSGNIESIAGHGFFTLPVEARGIGAKARRSVQDLAE